MSSCANQLALTGGPKDEDPPKIDTSASIKNYQTHFTKQDIDLYFDEYIDLRDASKQVLISPPLDKPPKVDARLKRVSFKFDEEEVLKDNATYVINFGKSIRDFNESNELTNYSFVFSTGAYIDSLSISGQVTDAKTGEPRKDALVALYVEHQDSIVFTEKPFYFARTDDQGNYTINNLRADTFKLATLSDENLSYTYDPDNEEIGFLDSLIILTDTVLASQDLEIFREATTPRYMSYDVVAQGEARIEFAGRIELDAMRVIDTVDHYMVKEDELTYLTMWYRPRRRKSMRYEIYRKDELDTIQMRINTRSVDTLEGRVEITYPNVVSKVGLHPLEDLQLAYDRPIDELNLNFISIIDTLDKDTLLFSSDAASFPKMKSSISYDWPVEKDLKITFLPGAIIDYFGMTNDTIIDHIFIAQEEDYGSMILQLANFDSVNHIIQLLDDKNVKRKTVVKAGEDEVSFDRLPPNTYTVQIIVDLVDNGLWDPGNYLEKRQSERIYEVSLDELRPNWEMEEVLDMNEIRQSFKAQTEPEEK